MKTKLLKGESACTLQQQPSEVGGGVAVLFGYLGHLQSRAELWAQAFGQFFPAWAGRNFSSWCNYRNSFLMCLWKTHPLLSRQVGRAADWSLTGLLNNRLCIDLEGAVLVTSCLLDMELSITTEASSVLSPAIRLSNCNVLWNALESIHSLTKTEVYCINRSPRQSVHRHSSELVRCGPSLRQCGRLLLTFLSSTCFETNPTSLKFSAHPRSASPVITLLPTLSIPLRKSSLWHSWVQRMVTPSKAMFSSKDESDGRIYLHSCLRWFGRLILKTSQYCSKGLLQWFGYFPV